MKIVVYDQNIKNKALDQFYEIVADSELKFFASEMLLFGFNDMEQIEQAVERAIKICKSASIPVRKNFKSVYLSYQGTVICDWKISSLGRKLLILNADASIPLVAETQVELIKNKVI